MEQKGLDFGGREEPRPAPRRRTLSVSVQVLDGPAEFPPAPSPWLLEGLEGSHESRTVAADSTSYRLIRSP